MVAQDAPHYLVFSKKMDHTLLIMSLKHAHITHIHGVTTPTCCTSRPQLVLDTPSEAVLKIKLKTICLNPKIFLRLLNNSSSAIQNVLEMTCSSPVSPTLESTFHTWPGKFTNPTSNTRSKITELFHQREPSITSRV